MLKQENVSVSWKTALFNIDIKKYLTGLHFGILSLEYFCAAVLQSCSPRHLHKALNLEHI